MGCFLSSSNQDGIGNPKQVRQTARKLYQEGVQCLNKKTPQKAIETFLNAADIDIRVNFKQTEFSFECFNKIGEIYFKEGDYLKASLYLKYLLDYYGCRNAIEQGTFVKEYAKTYKDLSKIYLQKKKRIKAYFFLQLGLAFVNEQSTLENEIVSSFTQEEKQVIKEIRKELTAALAIIEKNKHDDNDTAERYVEVGKRLVDLGRPADSLIFFKRALDYYTVKNFENPKYGEWIGLVYYETGQAYRDRGNQKKATLYLSLAKELVRSIETNRNMVNAYHERSLKKLSESDKATSETLTREKLKIHNEIAQNETETSDVYFSYLVIGKDLNECGKYDQAFIYLNRAYDFASFKSYHDSSFGEFFGEIALNLGKSYFGKKKFVEAQFFIERSIHLLHEPLRTEAASQLSSLNSELNHLGKSSIMSNLTHKTIEKRAQRADHSHFKKILPKSYLDHPPNKT